MKILNKHIIILLFIISCSNKEIMPNDWCKGQIVDIYCPVGQICYHDSCRYTLTYCSDCQRVELGRGEYAYGWHKVNWEKTYRTPFPYPKRTDLDKIIEPKTHLIRYSLR